jgi:hypothetical protein
MTPQYVENLLLTTRSFSTDTPQKMAPKKGGSAKPRGNATEEVEETLQAVVCCYLITRFKPILLDANHFVRLGSSGYL